MTNRIELLKEGKRFLSENGIENAKGETEAFLAHLLDCSRLELYLEHCLVGAREQKTFWGLLSQRAAGLPLQYLLGVTEFMGLPFKVRPGVFIPRPETEILVETAVSTLTRQPANPPTRQPAILDLGCGCGNIAISCAKYFNQALIFACDIFDSALQLSSENARLNQVEVSLVKSDLFGGFSQKEFFSLIVSNPPYIKTGELPNLSPELSFEPALALDGGSDGLDFYRLIFEQYREYLQREGFLIFEIGDRQKQAIVQLLRETDALCSYSVIQDYNNRDRVIVVQKK